MTNLMLVQMKSASTGTTDVETCTFIVKIKV
mgnify:CR=1 FL=1